MPNNYYFDPRYDDGLERYSRARYAQESIPSTRSWRQNARDVAEYGLAMKRASDELAADYERYYRPQAEAMRRKELYRKKPRDWSDEDIDILAYDMMNDNPDYIPADRGYEAYMPERIAVDDSGRIKEFMRTADDIRNGTYKPPVDEYGNEYEGAFEKNVNDLYVSRYLDRMQPHSIRQTRVPSKAEAFLFGVNPDTEEHEFLSPKTLAYMVPGVGEYLYGTEVAEQIGKGGMPGFVETAAFGVPMAKAAARRAFRGVKGLLNAQRVSDARRAVQGEIDRQMRRNALPQPKVRRQNARTGRWDEVNAYPEFTPYEEVRF